MTLIESILADSGKRLSELNMITLAEKRRILKEFNQPALEFLENQNMVYEFEAWAEKTPNKTAVLFGEHEVTYAELNARANQLAGLLLSKGLCDEDTVGIMKNAGYG